ncbi:MAG: hypothetical protein JOZ32_11000 [Bryobacterales bacterium]|nr:hypothetical protein [Bryobacterales bacterium]
MLGRVTLYGLLLTLRAFAGDDIGVLHPMCGLPYQYILEITNYRGHRLAQAIKFKVFGDYGLQLYANQWVDSPRDDDAKSSRVQILHVSRHWWRTMEMSGNFEIMFTDDRKLEGSFKAKYVKPPGLFICE